MPRTVDKSNLLEEPILHAFGLNSAMIGQAIEYVYRILDGIDGQLTEAGGDRLSSLVELANLSAIVGNLFRVGLVRASNGGFQANKPHTYPDLLGRGPGCVDLEIKVALENNKPKGHLVKPGSHLTLRYVLGGPDGAYVKGKENRGEVVWIWEVRVGNLREEHFSFSNTEGDSGKTAVITKDGMNALRAVYLDLPRVPVSMTSDVVVEYQTRKRAFQTAPAGGRT